MNNVALTLDEMNTLITWVDHILWEIRDSEELRAVRGKLVESRWDNFGVELDIGDKFKALWNGGVMTEFTLTGVRTHQDKGVFLEASLEGNKYKCLIHHHDVKEPRLYSLSKAKRTLREDD